MDNEENNIANETEQPKQKIGSKIAPYISKANQLRQDYQNGGLTDVAKNVINDNIGSKVNAAKEKAKGKVNTAKGALKRKFNDKLPDSVKQKKAQIDAKKKAVRDKINAPKDKINNMKQQLDDKRKKTNVKAFKSAAREIANAAAPGSGIAVDALLNSEKGKPAVKEAENASNPASAVTKGGKKLIEITVKDQIKKKVFIYITPVVCCAALILILIGSIINKYSDNIEYISKKLLPLISTLNFGGSPDSDTNLNDLSKNTSIDMSNPIYNEFYNNVSDLGGTNKIMVIAVLTSYKNNDEYTTKADYTTDIVQNTDSKQMKAYIKMVADAISESGGDISQGDYSKPGESGSSFFKWLYNDFVEQYYYEYFNTLTKESIPNMKVKLVKAIYDYYELLIKYFPLTESEFSLTTAASCPNGITVTGNNGNTKNYLITISRPDTRNANAYLKSLTIDGKDIEFEKDIVEYEYKVGKNVDSLDIKAVPELESSKVEISGNEKFQLGKNTVTITVKAEDNSEKVYKIIVIKEENVSDDLYLDNLKIKGYDINFDKEKFEYTLKIKNEKELDIIAFASNGYKTEIVGNESLKDGSIIKIIVSDEDGNSNIYKIKIEMDNNEVSSSSSDGINYIPYIMTSLLVILFILDLIQVIKRLRNK